MNIEKHYDKTLRLEVKENKNVRKFLSLNYIPKYTILKKNHSFIKDENANKYRIHKMESMKYHSPNFRTEQNTRKKLSKSRFFSTSNTEKNSENKSFNKIEAIKNIKTRTKESFCQNRQRYDNFGNIINKRNKRNFHINFLDQHNEKKLDEIIFIESYKKYNYIKDNDLNNENNVLNKCCNIY